MQNFPVLSFARNFRRHCHELSNLSALVWTSSPEVQHCPAASCEAVHFLTDKLCGWHPTPLAKWLMQHIHYTLVETSVDWMSSEQHSYGHLLQVDLPRGTWYAHALAVAYADFRPQHVRWRLPFRLASWMQSMAPNSTLALSWTCCILMTMNSVGKSSLAFLGHKTVQQMRLAQYK